jgi:dTDP-4-amino-4,6-dideoxygalactose transaminase
MKKIKFIDLHKQYLTIKAEIDNAIASVIGDSAFVGGKYLAGFEKNFASYQHTDFCIGTGNGTDALEIALEVLGLPSGSEIIVPANTFIATAEAVIRTGNKIVFCDISENYTISINDLEKKITAKTKVIIPVHLYGHPADMDKITEIADKYKLTIIEDCAQAHGAEYKGKRVGTFGIAGTFSFYPGKNLGAYGDGGAIISNNEAFTEKCRIVANHGRTGQYEHSFEGRNSRLDGMQAAILDIKLKYLEKWTENRISLALQYVKNLSKISEIILPFAENWARHVYHLFVIRTEKRDELRQFLHDNDIETGIHYPFALPQQPVYANKDFNINTEKYLACEQSKQLLSLPIGEHLTSAEIDYVCQKIKEFFLI